MKFYLAKWPTTDANRCKVRNREYHMAMLEIDSVVNAVVLSAQSTVLLRSDEHDILVNHHEIFWPPWPNVEIAERFKIGSIISVYILGYLYPRYQFLGSIKRVDREGNPYRRLSRQEPRSVFRGRVDRLIPGEDAFAINLSGYGIGGKLPVRNLYRLGLQSLDRGSEVSVVIQHLDIHNEVLELDLAMEQKNTGGSQNQGEHETGTATAPRA